MSLTVSNGIIIRTGIKTNYITVNNLPPVAAFVADQTVIGKGETVHFTDQSINSVTSWLWDFGDGDTSTNQSPSHTYNTTGAYTVLLSVTNAQGSDIETKTDYITVINYGNGVTDYDGNIYKTVIIGNQEWMGENLKAITYNDGTTITLEEDNTAWGNLSTEAYCWYDNDSDSYSQTYGALYNWYTVNTGKLCPSGWHVPTDAEWKELEMYLGMSQSDVDDVGSRGTNEGSKLAGNAILWHDGDLENNSEFGTSGFTALPGGYRLDYGASYGIGNHVAWWSTSEYSTANAWCRSITFYRCDVQRSCNDRVMGYSVRCVKDE